MLKKVPHQSWIPGAASLLLLPWPHVREEDRLTVRVSETLFTHCKEGQIKRSSLGQSREGDAIRSVSARVLFLNFCSEKYEVNSYLINCALNILEYLATLKGKFFIGSWNFLHSP